MTRSSLSVRIDRLELDLRGVSPQAAQSALAQLGPALAQALTAQGARLRGARPVQPDRAGAQLPSARERDGTHIDAGRLELSAAAEGATLAKAMAARIAAALANGASSPPKGGSRR